MPGKTPFDTSKRVASVAYKLNNEDYGSISEADWTFFLVLYAEKHRWKVVHFPDSIKILGSAGAPDLLMMRGDKTITAELKTEKGQLSRFQKMWKNSNPMNYQVWRPSEWEWIKYELA